MPTRRSDRVLFILKGLQNFENGLLSSSFGRNKIKGAAMV
jgi:hypothetical protein